MRYQFGQFVLDTSSGSVMGPEGPVVLRRQTFRLLEVLLSHAPELLDRDTLLDEAWGRTALSPNVLPQAISELRQALGDSAQSPQYIETLHRRGYRIACPVEIISEAHEPPRDSPAIKTTGETKPVSPYAPASSTTTSVPWLGLVASLAVLIVVSALWWKEATERRVLHAQTLPEIHGLMETDVPAAWRKARTVLDRAPRDPVLKQFWLDLTLPIDLTSEPEGALVEVKGYRELEEDWIELGRTPLTGVELPIAQLRFRVSLDGYRTLESAAGILPSAQPFILHPIEVAPEDMVYVSAGTVTYMDQSREVPGFWIDRLEVTNAQYRQFIDDGGYRRQEFWRYPAVENGVELTWEELMERLVDTTGLPGPSTWAAGTWPEGKSDHPVEGVSWYEAAAYAEYAGKQLPTVFHWSRASGLGTPQLQQFSDILMMSNFNSRGTVPAGSMAGLGHNGTLDMAGNVAEWCYNTDGEIRHLLGGSWMENHYRFRDPEAWPPLERRAGFGFRLIRQDDPIAPELTANVVFPERDLSDPVDDAAFAIIARQFDYDHGPLAELIDEVDESHRDWRREWVSFAAAYPNDRVIAQIYLPRHVQPPYQTVIYYPAGDAILLDSSRKAGLHHIEYFIRSGRAVVYPVLLGTFERKQPPPDGPISNRNLLIHQVKDMRRTIDYLETRPDIDSDRLLLYGISYGGIRAPFLLAVEARIRAAIILSAGMITAGRLPEDMRLKNYLARIGIPFLLINGKHDFNFPPETSQIPYFEALGTPPEHKNHLILDWGHIPPNFTEVIRACLDWADRWLGPVDRPPEDA
jgi:DNA-binding winged helix-turn-helix (wHTH) protein